MEELRYSHISVSRAQSTIAQDIIFNCKLTMLHIFDEILLKDAVKIEKSRSQPEDVMYTVEQVSQIFLL